MAHLHWPRVRFSLAAFSSLVASAPVWSQSRRTGPEILYEKSSEVNPPEGGRTAVFFVDGCCEANAALNEAIRSKKSEDKLIVIHFVDSEAPLFFDLPVAIVHTPEEVAAIKERLYNEAREMTLRYKSILEANKVSNVELILMPCVRPQSRAVKFVGDVGAEVVYVGTHNLGPIARTFLGSFSHYVLHNTTHGCVVVARDSKPPVVRERNQAEKPKLEEKLAEVKRDGTKSNGKEQTQNLSAEDEVMLALQSLDIIDDCARNEGSKQNASPTKAAVERESDNIDGFILVGPPSLP